MRKRYSAWEQATLNTLQRDRKDIASTVVAASNLKATSKKLVVARSPSQNAGLLAEVHGTLEAPVLAIHLSQTDTMLYLGQKFLSTKINNSKLIDTNEIKERLQASVGTRSNPTLMPFTADVRPAVLCSDLTNQNFDDQVGVSMDASLDTSSATAIIIFDCDVQGASWLFQLARRVFVCKDVDLDILVKRNVEKQVTDYIIQKHDLKLDSPLPLPTTAKTRFDMIGTTISECFVALLKASSSVDGFIAKPIVPAKPSLYRLPPDKDLAIALSTHSCEALISSIIDQYERDPNMYSFFNQAYFHKWLDKNVTVSLDANLHALSFYVGFGAKYEDTTAGKDWNVEVRGRVPIQCTFESSVGINGLNVQLRVLQTGEIEITSSDLHAGVIGDILKTITSIVQDKVNELKNQMQFKIDIKVPFFAIPNATGFEPIVTADILILELNVN